MRLALRIPLLLLIVIVILIRLEVTEKNQEMRFPFGPRSPLEALLKARFDALSGILVLPG